MMKTNLASKITALVVLILLLTIIILIGGANWITKTFYQNQLSAEVEGRILSHAHLLEKEFDEQMVEYIEEIEVRRNSQFLILENDLEILSVSDLVPESERHNYLRWINEHLSNVGEVDQPFIDHVATHMPFHIPHIWALMPVFQDNEIIGYVFLDQDTGDLNQARIKLILLFVIMGAITFGIGIILTTYLTKKISKPLNHISKLTQNIADGDLDIELGIKGEDEVGRLASSIQSMSKQLKEYRDSRRHFISHISHDLRTPITYIKGYSAVMKEVPPDDNEEWKRNLQVIYQEATRMEHLVSDLFLLTKLEEGKLKLELEEVPLCSWVTSLYESRAIMFDQKTINHKLNIDENIEGKSLFVDPYRMEQALINIIENAIRYTPKNGSIDIHVDERDNHIAISILDSGQGIPKADLPYIWDRFYKVDRSRSGNDSGTGLGLAIVKEIVEAHGGFVTVKSNVGEGTTFTMYLPIQ
ncbi:ATP-binding protein [Evansella sp. AB-rgal1]|uniref:HAMP domain-containing sensor histidine kinase n=1 Tax=Evansella sp. AB-rgal1 TaxID=3242696 RepID=UPI00359EA5F9